MGSFCGYGLYGCVVCVGLDVKFGKLCFGSVWVFGKVCILHVGRVYMWVWCSWRLSCLLDTFFCISFGGF
jgi:hypothetical protein